MFSRVRRGSSARRGVAAVVGGLVVVLSAGVGLASSSRAASPGVVGAAATPSGTGFWTVTAAGAVTSQGTARSFGSLAEQTTTRTTATAAPIVGMAAAPDGGGYWLVSSAGAIRTFGDAHSFGSLSGSHVVHHILGMAATPDGLGYWMVGEHGWVYAFGDARLYGSAGTTHLAHPVVGIAATVDGNGYWLVTSDGRVLPYGDAGDFGGTAFTHLSSSIVALASTPDQAGYWMVTATGSVHAFGDARLQGSATPGSTTYGLVATVGGGYTLLTSAGAEHMGPAGAAAADSTGLSSTIGTSTTPQVVRVGSTLREVNPSNPKAYLPGDFKFSGVDAYEATTDWPSENVGCGYSLPSGYLPDLFTSLGPDAVVRAWFFQTLDQNEYNSQINWGPFDNVVHEADQAGVHLIATLGNQDGTCDDSIWKDPSWYSGGYKTAAYGQLYSYQDWVKLITARYKNDPSIMAWEPINEPRPDTCTNTSDCWDNRTCPSDQVANQSLRGFYDAIGADIRASDPNHLISDGAPPVEGCGTNTWADMQNLEASPGIDLMSFHDYTGASLFGSASNWSQISAAVHKPLFAGEDGGINATDDADQGTACPDQSQRAAAYRTKASNEFTSMPFFTGWLLWNASPGNFQSCDYETWTSDPLISALAAVAKTARQSN